MHLPVDNRQPSTQATPLSQVVTETDISDQRSDVLGCAEAAVAATVGVVGGGKAIARVIADRTLAEQVLEQGIVNALALLP